MDFNNATPEARAQAVALMNANGVTWRNAGHYRLYFNNAFLDDTTGNMALSERCRTFYLDMTTDGAWRFCNENGSECTEFDNQYYAQLVRRANACAPKIY